MLSDLYVHRPGWLQRRDARVKLALLLGTVILVVAAPGVAALAALIAALHGALLLSRVPLARLGAVLRTLLPVMVVLLLLGPWGAPSGTLWGQWGPLRLTSGGVATAALNALRLWAMSLSVMALLLTTSQPELLRGLLALGLPYRAGLMLSLTLSAIPSLARQLTLIQEAQAARGWDPARGAWWQRLRSLGPLFAALLIHLFRSADSLTMALVARGLNHPRRRLPRAAPLVAADWATLLLALLLLAALLAWRVRG